MILYHTILLYAISQSLQQEKTGILGNCVFATFSKNIKQLTLFIDNILNNRLL